MGNVVDSDLLWWFYNKMIVYKTNAERAAYIAGIRAVSEAKVSNGRFPARSVDTRESGFTEREKEKRRKYMRRYRRQKAAEAREKARAARGVTRAKALKVGHKKLAGLVLRLKTKTAKAKVTKTAKKK